MDALPVVVAFDIREQIAPGLVAGCPAPVMDELDLERVEEPLHRRIVVAAARAAHRWRGPHRGEPPGGGFRRILAAAVGMADEAFGRRCRWAAMISAARGSSVRMWSRIAQPTILRVARSRTAAR